MGGEMNAAVSTAAKAKPATTIPHTVGMMLALPLLSLLLQPPTLSLFLFLSLYLPLDSLLPVGLLLVSGA